MAVRLRLRRMGKKRQAFYRIVAIDGRERRDGRYLENLGYYNPIKDPAELDVKVDRALYWLGVGAQPSDTVRSLLRRTGVNLRFDLKKRGMSDEQIEAEVQKWQAQQEDREKRRQAETEQKKRAAAKEAEKAKKEEAAREEAARKEAAAKEAAEKEAEAKADASAETDTDEAPTSEPEIEASSDSTDNAPETEASAEPAAEEKKADE